MVFWTTGMRRQITPEKKPAFCHHSPPQKHHWKYIQGTWIPAGSGPGKIIIAHHQFWRRHHLTLLPSVTYQQAHHRRSINGEPAQAHTGIDKEIKLPELTAKERSRIFPYKYLSWSHLNLLTLSSAVKTYLRYNPKTTGTNSTSALPCRESCFYFIFKHPKNQMSCVQLKFIMATMVA